MFNNTPDNDPNSLNRRPNPSSNYLASQVPKRPQDPQVIRRERGNISDRPRFAPAEAPGEVLGSFVPQQNTPQIDPYHPNGYGHQLPYNTEHNLRSSSDQATNFYNPSQYGPRTTHPFNSYSFNTQQSAHQNPTAPIPAPIIPSPQSDFTSFNPSSQAGPQSTYFEAPPQQYRYTHATPQLAQSIPTPLQSQQTQAQQQQPMQAMQNAVPFMLAGMQQMASGGGPNSNIGAQLFDTFAPGAMVYTNQLFGQGQERVSSFMKMPKYYFAVNHMYVLKKLALILAPFRNRTWARQRGVGPGQYEGTVSDGTSSYMLPRDDVNAPDLYIPLMSFLTYVLMVGFVFGMRHKFKAEILARYFSKGLGVLSLEVLIIKLGLYLINARPSPWLDVIAYRGYKFVGVVLTTLSGIVMPRLYFPVMVYSATAMGIFLMRSHRRIILPRDTDSHHAQDLARRNGFLLFLSVLQYPVYWVLVLDMRS